MAKQIVTDGYVFDFSNKVVDAFEFDTPDRFKGGPSMKAVDIFAEFPQEILFIELKRYRPNHGIDFQCPLWDNKSLIWRKCPLATDESKKVQASLKRITHDLRQKYCDTFLYCYANNRLRKEISYICVVEGLDTALALRLQERLMNILPHNNPDSKTLWPGRIANKIAVVNATKWNTGPWRQYGKCSLSPT